jgi:hypothetical protein
MNTSQTINQIQLHDSILEGYAFLTILCQKFELSLRRVSILVGAQQEHLFSGCNANKPQSEKMRLNATDAAFSDSCSNHVIIAHALS